MTNHTPHLSPELTVDILDALSAAGFHRTPSPDTWWARTTDPDVEFKVRITGATLYFTAIRINDETGLSDIVSSARFTADPIGLGMFILASGVTV